MALVNHCPCNAPAGPRLFRSMKYDSSYREECKPSILFPSKHTSGATSSFIIELCIFLTPSKNVLTSRKCNNIYVSDPFLPQPHQHKSGILGLIFFRFRGVIQYMFGIKSSTVSVCIKRIFRDNVCVLLWCPIVPVVGVSPDHVPIGI